MRYLLSWDSFGRDWKYNTRAQRLLFHEIHNALRENGGLPSHLPYIPPLSWQALFEEPERHFYCYWLSDRKQRFHRLSEQKEWRIVFCKEEQVQEALDAGADYAGGQDLVAKIQGENWFEFDTVIASPNMMGVAAGLSTMGYVPFVSSFAMFAAGRAFEQIRNSVAYPHLNVKIGATHGGISVGEDGASHQCCEDFALMRSLPGMTIICPADDVEARAAVRAAYEMQGPVYLRFGRLAVPVFHDEASYHFEIGKGEQLTEGSDIAIVATGLMVNEARKAAETLAAEGIHARVINIHTIKPLDEDIILKAAKECGKIVTAEEHNVIGGLGEAVCSLLSEKLPTPVRRVGVQDRFGCSGPAWDLLKEYDLDAATICKTAKEMLGR